jgi:hypothetical protein
MGVVEGVAIQGVRVVSSFPAPSFQFPLDLSDVAASFAEANGGQVGEVGSRSIPLDPARPRSIPLDSKVLSPCEPLKIRFRF